MVRGSSFREKKDLIDVGYFQSERLVNMANHNYSKTTGVEPNVTFTPDGGVEKGFAVRVDTGAGAQAS